MTITLTKIYTITRKGLPNIEVSMTFEGEHILALDRALAGMAATDEALRDEVPLCPLGSERQKAIIQLRAEADQLRKRIAKFGPE